MRLRRALTAVCLCAALFLGPRISSAGPVTLSYSNFFPPNHVMSKLAEDWCREVEKRSGGKIAFNYFPGQTLTKADQVYDGVVNGISDVGMSLFSYTRGRFPVMQAVDLPLGYPSGKVATAVVGEVYRELKPKELNDVKVLYLHAHGPGLIWTKSRPVRTMNDMRGIKFRATGASADLIKALGGTPVAMPMPETYQSLLTGVADGAAYPMEASKGWKLAEVTKYLTECYPVAYTSSFFAVMNKAKWDALPADVKKVIDQVSAEWVPKTAEAWDEIDREGLEYFKSKGGEVIALPADESARWKKAVAPVLDAYVEDAKKKGVDGKKALSVAEKVLAKDSRK
ncbi:MAG: TRAP transporter substrate-binding protein [Deltaproteobacteria bacterium]|nr:TRAP transporter substrate-binding protein [Deltaproteobacteria bacterium]